MIAKITRLSTSSTIAATHTSAPSGVESSPNVAISRVAMPMEVELSAVPATTPVVASNPAATMNAVPSAMGSAVPATAIRHATEPTRLSEGTSTESPPSITRSTSPRSPTKKTARTA